MKRPLTILTIVLLAGVFLYACSSTIRTANTSLVTITIGDTPNRALLKAEAATPWARFKYFLANAKLMPEAQAYIPSIVQAIIVTVSAADMPTPIVGIANIAATDTTASIRIEVPNGSARLFTVEGIRGIDSKTYFQGTATADLSGLDVNLPISMNFVGTGIYVDPTKLLSANTPTCGSTQALACATITHVLNTRPSTTNNDVILALAGNYIPGTVAVIESFPLQLKPGMALLCLGPLEPVGLSPTSVFLPNTTAILGADGASIDNCRIVVSLNNVGIIDLFGGQTPAKIRVNGSQMELSGNLTGGTMSGIDLYSDSTVLETSITGTGSGAFGSIFGIQVWGGKPSIIGSTISYLPTGIELRATAGDVAVSNSFLIGNTTVGLETVSTGKPSISNTVFDGNAIGILLGDGNPRITGSTFINSNNFGIEIISASPEISTSVITNNYIGILDSRTTYTSGFVNDNSIYCNNSFNLSTSITTTPNYQKNAWERAAPIVSGIAVGTNCAWGDDICANGPAMPDFSGFKPAVPGVCNRGTQPAKPQI